MVSTKKHSDDNGDKNGIKVKAKKVVVKKTAEKHQKLYKAKKQTKK